MSMENMKKLREMLCEELDKIAKKGQMSSGDLEAAQKLTDTIKNIDKIEYLEDEGSYSERGGSYGRYSRDDGGNGGSYGDGYGGGSSYARRGEHYVRGHYSRDGGGSYHDGGGYSGRRYYSRDDGREQMMYQLGEMMESADDRQREIIRKAMEDLRSA